MPNRTPGKALVRLRHLIQAAVIILFFSPALLAITGLLELHQSAFSGSLSSSSFLGTLVLSDPLAAIQAFLAAKALLNPTLALSAAAVWLFYALIGGRAFCGWICPVNSILELLEPLARQSRKLLKVGESGLGGRRLKIGVLVVVLIASLVTSLPVFELINPIPSILRALYMGTTLGLSLLAAIVVAELFLGKRLWCRHLCPLGGLYQLSGRLGAFRVVSKGGCTGCAACKRSCLANPEILDGIICQGKSRVASGDCLLCGKCLASCPEQILAIHPQLPWK